MGAIVEMSRDAAEPSGRNRFSCSLVAWEFLRELGETFGWRPQGTTYTASPAAKIEAAARRNYEPGEALDQKRIEADDALAWASALEMARTSAHLPAILSARAAAKSGVEASAETLSNVLEEFTEYAYGGAFVFAIRSDSSAGSRSK
jgi:hypothetical protein